MNRFLHAPLEPSIKALNASLGELSQVVPDDNGAFEVHALSASAE